MQEPTTQQDQAHDPLAVRQPILAVGTKNRYLFAYPTLDKAVEKLNADFLEGGYYELHGAFDRYRLTQELRFFDAAGHELEPDWDPKVRPAHDKDAGYRLISLRVRTEEPYVQSRYRMGLAEGKPEIQAWRQQRAAASLNVDDLPEQLTDKDLSFERFCDHLVEVLSDAYADGFWHKFWGGD